MPFMYEQFLQDNTDSVKPIAMQYNERKRESKEFIFIHAFENVIEKNLGKDEVMLANKEAVIAFTESVQIMEVAVGKQQMVKFKGPGFVYIETGAAQDDFHIKTLEQLL